MHMGGYVPSADNICPKKDASQDNNIDARRNQAESEWVNGSKHLDVHSTILRYKCLATSLLKEVDNDNDNSPLEIVPL